MLRAVLIGFALGVLLVGTERFVGQEDAPAAAVAGQAIAGAGTPRIVPEPDLPDRGPNTGPETGLVSG